MNWTAVENALRAWVKAGSGLDNEHVIWAEQGGPRPDGAFVTVRIGDLVPVGAFDEVTHGYDATQPLGEEIEHVVRGERSCMVSVQAFTPEVMGSASARAVASRVLTALQRPSVRDALEAAGLSVYDPGTVKYVPAIVGTEFEARAVLEVGFYLVETASERGGYIAKVQVTNEEPTPDQTFTVELS